MLSFLSFVLLRRIVDKDDKHKDEDFFDLKKKELLPGLTNDATQLHKDFIMYDWPNERVFIRDARVCMGGSRIFIAVMPQGRNDNVYYLTPNTAFQKHLALEENTMHKGSVLEIRGERKNPTKSTRFPTTHAIISNRGTLGFAGGSRYYGSCMRSLRSVIRKGVLRVGFADVLRTMKETKYDSKWIPGASSAV